MKTNALQPPAGIWISHHLISDDEQHTKHNHSGEFSPLVDFGFVQQGLGLVEFDQDVWRGDWLADSEDAGVALGEGAVPKPGSGGRQGATVSGVIGGGHRLTVQAWAGVDAP